MKFEYEKKVMQDLYLIKKTRGADLTLHGIWMGMEIQKSTLQRILSRLEKRGWIKRIEVWDPEQKTILWGTHDFNYKQVLKNAKGKYQMKVEHAKKELRKALYPEKKVAYRIERFPFLLGDEEGVSVPKGYAQRWRKASNESKQAIKEYRESWKKDKKLMEDKKKSIEKEIKRFNPLIYNIKDYTQLDISRKKEKLEEELVNVKEELYRLQFRKGKKIIAVPYKPI